jgi:hypothetical protein
MTTEASQQPSDYGHPLAFWYFLISERRASLR